MLRDHACPHCGWSAAHPGAMDVSQLLVQMAKAKVFETIPANLKRFIVALIKTAASQVCFT
jgi:hypothetical protein